MGLIFYVCNRKKSCNKSATCVANDEHGCTHTLNREYALYDDHDDLELDDYGNYWERIRNEQRR